MFTKRRRKFHSISEIHTLITSLEQKSKRMPDIIGFRSIDTCKNFKDLITLCNSLSIVFIQYNLIQDCLILLKTAGEADANLCKHGTVLDRLWQSRLLTYNNLAFLYHKVNQPSDSLKFLYEAHGLAQSIKESGGIANYDLIVSTNILTFITLWKLRRFKQAAIYAELAGEALSLMSSGKKASRIGENGGQNLFGIVAICMAGLAVQVEGSFKKGIAILEDSLNQVEEDGAMYLLVKEQIREIYKRKNLNGSMLDSSNSEISIENSPIDDFLPKIPSEVLHSQLKQNFDWLVSKDFESIFFITCFVPFIDPATPLIRTSELESYSQKHKPPDYIESSYAIEELPQEVEVEDQLPEIKKQSIYKKFRSSKQSSNRKRSALDKGSAQRNLAWWEKRTESRYPSEPRGSSYSNRQQLPRINTPFKGEVLNSNQSSTRKGKEIRNHHIMLEFNPMHGENVPVEFVPVPPTRSKKKYPAFNNAFDSYYMDYCD